jgi:hypothetical protein
MIRRALEAPKEGPMLRSGLVLVAVILSVQASPDLREVLGRAGDYVVALQRELTLVAADERSVQVRRGYGVSSGPDKGGPGLGAGESSGHVMRDLRGTCVLVATPDDGVWQGYRDFYELQSRPLHDQKERLPRLFTDTPATALADARKIHAESARQNLTPIRHNLSVPTFALMVVAPVNRDRFEFKKKGEKKVGDARGWVIAFTETRKPTFIASASGTSMPMRGEIVVEPESGRVLRTQVVVDSLDAFEELRRRPEKYAESFPRMQMEVAWGPSAALGRWVPLEMKELYDRQAEVISCTNTYVNYRKVPGDAAALFRK